MRHLDGLKVYTISLQKREAGVVLSAGAGRGPGGLSPRRALSVARLNSLVELKTSKRHHEKE